MSTVAMFSKTGSTDFPDFLKCMITGPPKSGKTTLLGTVPNILVLDTEPHANNLQSIAHLDVPFKAINSTDDLRQAQFILSQDGFRQQAAQALGLPDIEAVAIDTVDTLQALMKRERMKEKRQSQFLRDDWGWLKEEMTSILESFLQLPMHVFLIVHTKTKDIGSENNPQTVVLPGLEGAIAEQIAGMVGYSLLSFRDEQIRPDGTKFTKYWLRAEGNETYQFLGNRAAGRLPDVIEPDFKTLLDAAMAGRPTQQHAQVSVDLGAQTTGQLGQQQPPAPQQPLAPPLQNTAGAPQQAVGAGPTSQAPAPQQQQAPADRPADDEPINAAALGFVQRVYEACALPFPEEKIRALNLGQARSIVGMMKAAHADHAEGKGPDPRVVLTDFLTNQGLLADGPGEEEKAVEPKLGGTIPEAKAYVGDSLERANEAFEYERTNGNRKTLMDWLESKGASHGGAAPVAPNPSTPPEQVQTDVQTPPEPAATPEPAQNAGPEPTPPSEAGVTQPPAEADATSTEDKQVALLEQQLGAEVIGTEIRPDAPCGECGNPIDDLDLAQLGLSRFKKVLCVADYIAETKKPRG